MLPLAATVVAALAAAACRMLLLAFTARRSRLVLPRCSRVLLPACSTHHCYLCSLAAAACCCLLQFLAVMISVLFLLCIHTVVTGSTSNFPLFKRLETLYCLISFLLGNVELQIEFELNLSYPERLAP